MKRLVLFLLKLMICILVILVIVVPPILFTDYIFPFTTTKIPLPINKDIFVESKVHDWIWDRNIYIHNTEFFWSAMAAPTVNHFIPKNISTTTLTFREIVAEISEVPLSLNYYILNIKNNFNCIFPACEPLPTINDIDKLYKKADKKLLVVIPQLYDINNYNDGRINIGEEQDFLVNINDTRVLSLGYDTTEGSNFYDPSLDKVLKEFRNTHSTSTLYDLANEEYNLLSNGIEISIRPYLKAWLMKFIFITVFWLFLLSSIVQIVSTVVNIFSRIFKNKIV